MLRLRFCCVQYFPVFQSTLSEVIRTYHRRRHTLTHGDAPSTAMAAITMAIVGMVTGMAEEVCPGGRKELCLKFDFMRAFVNHILAAYSMCVWHLAPGQFVILQCLALR